jgi:hypothetical protein
LTDPSLPRAKVLMRLKALLKARAGHRAFDPYAQQHILDLSPAIFAILRGETGKDQAMCLHNVSNTAQAVRLDLGQFPKRSAVDMLSGKIHTVSEKSLQLEPYQTVWLDLNE